MATFPTRPVLRGGAGSQELPGLDLARLQGYLEQARPGLLAGPLSGQLIAGGRSNLTYLIADGEHEWVLRRPPLGHVLATAHDMAREHRVMTALAGTDVPVPRTLLLCESREVLGAPFYLMDKVDGTVYRTTGQAETLTAGQRQELALALVDVLADLHELDPAAVELADFGRPSGYLERQVRRWSGQLAKSRSRDIPGIEELVTWLGASVPVTQQSAIVHGDYRLDNLIVIPGELRIVAVLDWEMATLGDPLADLGLLLVYWDGLGSLDNPIVDGLGVRAGFPAGDVLVRRYAERSRVDLAALDWYVAFGYFKLAVILEGIHYRFAQGQTVGGGFDRIGGLVEPLVRRGLAVANRSYLTSPAP